MSTASTLVTDIKTDITKIENWFKGVNWSAVQEDFDTAIKDLETVVEPILEVLFPGTASTINAVVNPVLAQVGVASKALTDTAEKYAAGNMTTDQLTSALAATKAAVVAATTLVSAAVGKPVS